jgi:hypothetical protein
MFTFFYRGKMIFTLSEAQNVQYNSQTVGGYVKNNLQMQQEWVFLKSLGSNSGLRSCSCPGWSGVFAKSKVCKSYTRIKKFLKEWQVTLSVLVPLLLYQPFSKTVSRSSVARSRGGPSANCTKSTAFWRKLTAISNFSKILLLFCYFWSFRVG